MRFFFRYGIALLCLTFAAVYMVGHGVTPLAADSRFVSWLNQTAAAFFATSITSAEIRENYHATTPVTVPKAPKRVRIMIVPGHQPHAGGTDFGGIYERNLTVDISTALARLLADNPHYDVTLARDKDEWNPILAAYFRDKKNEIDEFRKTQAAEMKQYLQSGSIVPEADQIYHVHTPSEAALQLYGINKWTSERDYDIVLHVHINDYPRSNMRVEGKYDGFAIYVPDHQYSNAVASRAVAQAIAHRLRAFHAFSTLPSESDGIIEDQELIAIGSNNSAEAAALLVEYGYIYEPQFQDKSVRDAAIADYAYQTYLGLQDFVRDPVKDRYGTLVLPYHWNVSEPLKGESAYALQAALHHLDLYPPPGKSLSDCPISGTVGECTRTAVKLFQEAQGLEQTGSLDVKTAQALEAEIAVH